MSTRKNHVAVALDALARATDALNAAGVQLNSATLAETDAGYQQDLLDCCVDAKEMARKAKRLSAILKAFA